MTEEQIEQKVTDVLPMANLAYAAFAGGVAYLTVGSVLVNPMGVLLVVVGMSALYFLPPVQKVLRSRLRALVVRVNK